MINKDRSSLGNRKSMPEYQKWILSYAILAGVVYWVSCMPSHFFEPYCLPRSSDTISEHYGSRLSKEFRHSLKYALEYRDIPYFEIGERVLVPFVDPGYWPDRQGGVERFVNLILGGSEKSWSLTVRKASGSATTGYADEHPNSEIAQLRNLRFKTFELDSSERSENLDELDCQLTKFISNPDLN